MALETIRQVLKRRDNMSASEIDDALADARADLRALVASGAGLTDIEDAIRDHFGLEPDYMDDEELGLWDSIAW